MNEIAIAGCTNRIGTTTQALQAVKALNTIGHKAIYLEANKNQYLKQIMDVYSNAKESTSKTFIIYSGITMCKWFCTKSINPLEWDFIVKDYGNVDSTNFEEASFAAQKIKVIVCGTKPNEICKVQEVLSNATFDDAYFIFSFVPEEEYISVKSLMCEHANKTFFANYIADPFIEHPSSRTIFKQILQLNKEGDIHGRK